MTLLFPSPGAATAAATDPATGEAFSSIGTPALWAWTIGGIVALFLLDFLITRKPHEV